MKKYIVSLIVLCGLSSVIFANDCTRNADETVSCIDSGLMWQDNAEANTTQKNWVGAISYCESLDFAGHNDWRLPNINELLSIVDYAKYNPAIKNGFTHTNSHYYFSSTYMRSAGTFFGPSSIYFEYGFRAMRTYAYVRCVRTGQ